MGSIMLTWMADAFREAGLKVVEYSGWKERARSTGGYDPGRPLCCMWHHTASNTSPDNDAYYMCYSSPDRPITNLMIARDGTVWCLAAGATNTNGKGKSLVFSTGTVPADSMNTHAVGMEICNNGVGESYPQAQIDCAFAVSNVLTQRLGLQPEDVSTHQFYAPDRKIDPATAAGVQGPWKPTSCTSSGSWDIGSLRGECQRRATAPPEPEPEPFMTSGSSSLWFGNNRLDVFLVGLDDGHLYHWWYTNADGGKWSKEDLGGVSEGVPSATGEGADGKPTRIDVTTMGVDDPPGLWHTWYTGGTKWHDWERIGDWPGGRP